MNSQTTTIIQERERYNSIEANSSKIKDFVLFPNQFLFVYNSHSTEILYNKGFYELTGLNYSLTSRSSFMNLIHEDEQDKVDKIFRKVYKFWLQFPTNPYQQVFSITFRIKKADGKYYNTYCQSMIINRSPKGILTLNIISDVTHFNAGANILWSITGQDSHKFYEENDYLDYEEHGLTLRELQVIKCLAKGMNNQETAEHLNISIYTVYTHRRNMMNRMKFKNIMQLVNYALKKGIIEV